MKKMLIILALLLTITCNIEVERLILDSFKDGPKKEYFKVFHHIYKKDYDINSEEAIIRYSAFKQNLKIIEETNAQNLSYQLGINQFADLTKEEFTEKHLMDPHEKRKAITATIRNLREEGYFDLNADNDDEGYFDLNADSDTSPSTNAYAPLDHRKFLLPPRDQKNCGSCWSFATTGAVEAAIAIRRNVTEYLSTQHLIDCDTSNNGCKGGLYPGSFKYAVQYGMVSEKVYPYKEMKNKCAVPSNAVRTKITSFQFCTNYSSAPNCSVDKVYSLLKSGPLAIGIDGSTIQLYKGGIFTATCTSDTHAVVLVGYGVDTITKREYFIVRNSWGPNWGENGYIRVARNDSNKRSCFATNEAFLPIA